MYKNLLIVGARKSGKTTVANLIGEKYNCNVINMDNIIEAFEETFPKDDSDNYVEFESNFIINYINKLLDKKNFYDTKKVVLEGNIPYLEKVIAGIDTEKIAIIGLTYNNIDLDKFASDIKTYATNLDIFRYYSEGIIKTKAKRFVEDNKNINEILEKLDINSYDVSENRKQVINEVINDVDALTSLGSTFKVKKK